MVPTIRDVAVRAGVSISTVSRVLNDSAVVADEKRGRVEAAVAALGYRPNPAARTLLGHKTGGIGVVLPYVAGAYFSVFLRGIDRFTSDRGMFLTVASSHRSRPELRAVLEGLVRRVDGLIVMSTEVPAAEIQSWLPPALPTVFVNTDVAGVEATAINFDNREGAELVAEHLVGLGHTVIGFVAGPAGSHDGDERRAGFVGALAAHGLAPAFEHPGDFTVEGGEAAVAELLACTPRPTAVFAANDDSALGVISGLRAAGLRVPEDVAVAGFDDVPLARLLSPALTTVHAPVDEMGRAAIRRLAARIGGAPADPGLTLLPTALVARDSTARA